MGLSALSLRFMAADRTAAAAAVYFLTADRGMGKPDIILVFFST